MTTVAVLLAGGTGTRLYPASRPGRPKQFLAFGGDRSLLSRTADRAAFADELVVLTRERYADEVPDHAPGATVLVEPAARDTGPALAYAAHEVRRRYDDPVMLCLPSDHHVAGEFAGTARDALAAARATDGLVTVGVEPTRPDTGYGYIEPGDAVPLDGATGAGGVDCRAVAAFREKPGPETARAFVDRGCLWNAGLFAWTPAAFLREARDSPLAGLVDALEAGDPDRAFDAVDPVSVDYAVLERTDAAYVVPAAFAWDDVGSWDAVGRLLDDRDGNAVDGDALALDAAGNVLASDDKHLSVVGVSDLVVAAYDDRVLVVPKGDSQRVRDVVAELRERGRYGDERGP